MPDRSKHEHDALTPVTLFLCGDVMTGRGIDQILPYPNDPRLYEPYVRSAVHYVEAAESLNGPIPRSADLSYIWGDALDELHRIKPTLRLINLETAVTASEERASKHIHYRMSPRNISCITAADIDCCVLANNHVLDWGYSGLSETLETLESAGLKSVGAGRNLAQAQAPAIFDLPAKGRLLVFAFGSMTSGIPLNWAATEDRPGVNLLEPPTGKNIEHVASMIRTLKRSEDVAVASIHWGGNWGFSIPRRHQQLAHALIDEAGIDIVHGHSSHHVKGLEVYKNKLILYGCGDFLTDYEGISGYEGFRDDLVLMYFPTVSSTSGDLLSLEMVPLRIERFRLNSASRADAQWLHDTLQRESEKFDLRIRLQDDNRLVLARSPAGQVTNTK